MGTADEPTAAKAAAFSRSLLGRKPTLEGEELCWNNGFQRSDSSGRCHGEDLVASCHRGWGVRGAWGASPVLGKCARPGHGSHHPPPLGHAAAAA